VWNTTATFSRRLSGVTRRGNRNDGADGKMGPPFVPIEGQGHSGRTLRPIDAAAAARCPAGSNCDVLTSPGVRGENRANITLDRFRRDTQTPYTGGD